MDTDVLFWLICGAAVLVMLIYYLKRKRKLSAFLFGSLSGTAALILLNKYGAYIGAELPLNLFSLLGSSVLGAPFVAVLVLLKYF